MKKALSGIPCSPGAGGESKFSVPKLKYGSRSHFIKGLVQCIGPRPANLMEALEHEFSLPLTWTDKHAKWRAGAYSAPDEWSKASSVIDRLMSLMEGEKIKTFDTLNAKAFVIGLRLYTSPAYKPLNDWMREVCDDDTPAPRKSELLSSGCTWAAFAHAVYGGFTALSQVFSYPIQDLFRGIDMDLAPEFFIP